MRLGSPSPPWYISTDRKASQAIFLLDFSFFLKSALAPKIWDATLNVAGTEKNVKQKMLIDNDFHVH